MAGIAAQSFNDEDLTVIVEGDESPVRELPGGHIAIDQGDGGVVIQLNPQRRQEAAEADEDPAKFYANLAERMDEGKLLVIAQGLYEGVGADDSSRSEWLADRANRMELLGLQSQSPSVGDGASAVDGQSVVTNPLLLDAMLRGWANAQAELLPAEGPCKIANYAPTPGQKDDELAEALQRDMNYFLTTTATEFVPETQHMLLWGTYFGGSGFKKVYSHPLKKRPVSEAVAPEHLIVSDAMKDLASCERITHQIMMRQSVMKRYMAKGIYREIHLGPPTPQPNQVEEQIAQTQGVTLNKDRPEDMPYTVWEIQCELDLPEFAPPQWKNTGVPLPYLVTMDKDSQQILAIRRDWKPEDEECERKKMYVKYPYVPGPGFYGTGLASILGNSTEAMTAAWREALDTGMYANFPSFLMDKLQGRQLTSDFRLSPGTGQAIETGGRPINEVVMALPYKDVTPGLLALIDKITEQSKQVAGAPEVPVGEGSANIPVGTMLAHIEQATKVMAAAHKGQHKAMDEELSMIVDLLRENPEALWKGNKQAKGFWNVQRLMEALEVYSLVPKSDPNVPSHTHRVMRAVALVELSKTKLGEATLEPQELMRRVLISMREDPNGLMKPPGATEQKDPMAEAKLKEAEAKMLTAQVNAEAAKTKLPVEQVKAQASIQGKQIELARTLAANDDEQKRAEIDAQIAQGEFQLKGREIESESWKREQDVQTDRMKLGVEQEKVGLGHREAEMAERQHNDQTELALGDQYLQREQLDHQRETDHQQVVTERAKVGVAGQQADTQRRTAEADSKTKKQQADTQAYVAKNPPKPAGGGSSKKKK